MRSISRTMLDLGPINKKKSLNFILDIRVDMETDVVLKMSK